MLVKSLNKYLVVYLRVLILMPLLFATTVASAQGEVDESAVLNRIKAPGTNCLEGQPCVGKVPGSAVEKSAAVAESVAESKTTAVEATATAPVDAAAPTSTATTSTSTSTSTSTATTTAAVPAFDAAAVYNAKCLACHAAGVAGAPKMGDAAAWAVRAEKGIDGLVATAVSGLNAMPPKGLCMECSESDLRAIIQYMLDNSK